jgi:hypothetical protein
MPNPDIATLSIPMREWRAMKCMEGLLSGQAPAVIAGTITPVQLAALAYVCADAMDIASKSKWDANNWDQAIWE